MFRACGESHYQIVGSNIDETIEGLLGHGIDIVARHLGRFAEHDCQVEEGMMAVVCSPRKRGSQTGSFCYRIETGAPMQGNMVIGESLFKRRVRLCGFGSSTTGAPEQGRRAHCASQICSKKQPYFLDRLLPITESGSNQAWLFRLEPKTGRRRH